VERVNRGFHDVLRSIEIGLTDFQVNDVSALLLKGAGADENLESCFGAQPRHAPGQM
jgi:hypothetical protein